MIPLEKTIIKTIAYYEALGEYPLTGLEIYRYLQKEKGMEVRPKFSEVLSRLRSSVSLATVIESHNGFYFIKDHQRFCHQRISRQKTSIKRWSKIRRIAVFLSLVPYLRGLLISGSLSINNTKKDSDIDFLVMTKESRIWTCRTFLVLFLQIIGQRRHGSLVANRVCLNQYVAQNQPDLEFQNLNNQTLSLSNAHLHSRLIPLTGFHNFQKLQTQNQWATNYLYFFPFAKNSHLRRVNETSPLFRLGRGGAKIVESIIDSSLGDYIEQRLGSWQTNRIQSKTAAQPPKTNELYLSDTLLLFHYPVCKNNETAIQYLQVTKLLPLS